MTMVYERSYLHMRCFQVNFPTSLVVISRNGLSSGLWQWSQYVYSSHGKGPKGAQIVEIVRRGTWNVCKLLASSASLCKVKSVYLKCWPVVASMHHLCCKGLSPYMETANSFVEFFLDIICPLAVQEL